MSYSISLNTVDGDPVEVDHHEGEGGTYAVGGSNRAELNVTYNYSEVVGLVNFSFRQIHEKTASETIEQLEAAYEDLGDRPYRDYWAPTPGNAGHAIGILLKWARQHPTAVWRVA